MATRSLGTLTLDVIAKTGGFVQGMSKAERESEKWRKKVEANVKAAGKAFGVALVGGTTAAAAGIALVVNRQRDLIDVQAKMAQRLRITYESLATLGRAGELAGVSMQQIEVASRTLDINLGRAAQGTGAQAEAFKKLRLSAEEISKLPLDQRIVAINKALLENVPAAERAAVAADVFGSRGAAAIQQLQPDVISEAARQVEIFGLNLSDVDAAKVEQANDAFSTFGLLADGLGKQLTVELAPILKAVGDEFLRSAEEAGGLGNQVQSAARITVNALAFVLDAADGVKVAFEIAADGIIIAFAAVRMKVLRDFSELAAAIDTIPFVDISGTVENLRRGADESKTIIKEAWDNIKQTLEEPLAGEQFREFYERAQESGQAAAEAAIEAREQTQSAAAAVEDATKEQEAYNRLIKDLRTDQEKLTEQVRERLAILGAVKDITDQERQSVLGRIADAATTDAPELTRSDTGAAQAQLENWYATQLELLEQFRKEHADLNAAWDEEELRVREEYERRTTEIQAENESQRRELLSEGYSALLDVVGEYFGGLQGEEAAYARMAISIGQTLLDERKREALQKIVANTQSAAMGAYDALASIPYVGPALGAVAAGVIYAAGGVATAKVTGLAHDGIDSVPQTGTWLLEKGERVTTAETSAKLDRTLDDVQRNQSRPTNDPGGNIRIVNSFDAGEVVGGYMGSSAGERDVLNIVKSNETLIRTIARG